MKYNFDLDLDTKNSISVIVNRIKKNSIILEFGPANGRLTKYLKEVLNCKVYCVEINPESAFDAAKYSEKMIVDSIENYKWLDEFSEIKFDFIIFADVLEHLYYPEEVLKKSKLLLRSSGSIILSVPNIAHNSIIMNLLNDQFEYMNVGILDNTHIRFFTKYSLDKFIYNAGLNIVYETGIHLNPLNTEFNNDYNNLNMEISDFIRNREYGEIYQFVVELKIETISKPIIDFRKNYNSKLYLSDNGIFDENNKLDTNFYLDSGCIEFTLNKEFKNIQSIRVDPLKNSFKIKLKNIFVNDKKIDEEIIHNGILNENNEIIFTHIDPQIIINFDKTKDIKKVVLNFYSIESNFDVNRYIIEEKNNKIKELNNLVQSMRLKNRFLNFFRRF